MRFENIFQQRGQQLFWARLPDSQIVDGATGALIEAEQHYLVIRLNEMYLRTIRVLWRKRYPMLHAFLTHANREEHGIAGPGQLKNLGEVNLDRMVNLNILLAGPIPFRGGDVSMLVGLYSVPGEDVGKALVETVGSLADLGGVALGQAQQVTNLVKNSVDRILALGDTELQLGVRDSFYPGNLLRAGHYVGINAPRQEIDHDRLWLDKGHLVSGNDPIVARPYEAHDYMVLEVERRDRREDWPSLPGILEYDTRFADVMREAQLSDTEKRGRLGALWPGFSQTLRDSPFLTRADQERIALSVSSDLNARLEALKTGNPFETKAWAEPSASRKSPEAFDLLDVPNYLVEGDAATIRAAKHAMVSNPFG